MLVPNPTPEGAERVLRQVFGRISAPFAFRLWNGREVGFGPGPPACIAAVKTPETFLRLIRNPTPDNFASAYVNSEIDLEGDLFAMMEVANVVEEIKLSPMTKLRLLLSLWRR